MAVNPFILDPPLLEDQPVVDSPDELTAMATNKEVKTWVSDEVRRVVDEAIDSFKPHGWRKVTHVLREWGLVAAAIAVPIALLGIAAAAWYFAFSEIGKNSEFRGTTEQRLKEIDKSLTVIQRLLAVQNPGKVLTEISDFDATTFTASLPVLRQAAEQPVTEVNATLPTLQRISEKLHQTSPATPDFWPTVAAIINYQSRVNQISGESPDPYKVSKPCALVTGPESFRNQLIHEHLSNCIVDLDTNSFTDVTFKDSVIRYHGGQTTLQNVAFINCTFLLDLSSLKRSPEKTTLLLSLLDSPDQKTVKIE
jgi:hypothetical protein